MHSRIPRKGNSPHNCKYRILNSEQVTIGVFIVPSPNLFSKQMMSASSAPFGRGSKNQKFSLPFLFSSAKKSRQKMERKFLVLLRCFRLQNESFYFLFVAYWYFSFLRPCGDTRRFLSAFCGSSKLHGFVHWSG